MTERRLKVLVISEYYPKPDFPQIGIFVKRQVERLVADCEVVVVCPVRVFPPLRLFKSLLKLNLGRFRSELAEWLRDVRDTPAESIEGGAQVYYPRYTSGPNQLLHPTVGFFAWRLLRKKLVRLHDEIGFDIVHGHYAVPSGYLANRFAESVGIKSVLSIHGRDFNYTAKRGSLNRALLRMIFRRAGLVCANSGRTERLLIEAGAPPERVVKVALGAIEPAPKPPARLSAKPRVIMSAANFYPNKRFDITLAAFKTLIDEGRDLTLELAGDGPLRAGLEASVKELGLSEKVKFHGRVHPEKMIELYDHADLFVLPAVDEAFGLVYVEALARGVPPVGCRGEGGPEDLAAEAECIALVEPDDHRSLAAALGRLIDDDDYRMRLAENGLKLVRTKYTWEKNAETTIALYRELISGKR